MRRFWRGFAVMTAVILAGSSTLYAHEECDGTSPTRSAAAVSDQHVGPTFSTRIGRHDSTLSVSARTIGDQSRHDGDLGQSGRDPAYRHIGHAGKPEWSGKPASFRQGCHSQFHLRSSRRLRIFLRTPPIHARPDSHPMTLRANSG